MRPIREREQRAAAEVLGVSSVTFLGELDGELEVTLDTRRKVCREVRRLRPDVIVAPDPQRLWSGTGYINHSDHKAAGALALSAVMPDSPTRLMFPELLDEGLEPFEVPALWLVTLEPDTYVDITETMELKIEALPSTRARARRSPSPGFACARRRPRPRPRRRGPRWSSPSRSGRSRFTDDESPLDEE